ncbi:hypothetical protein [Nocardia iowensis]|uniref:hypothetical protein n=1 Tax=Nocardia iowensis TaxID=204891 RepID=UPI0031EEB004
MSRRPSLTPSTPAPPFHDQTPGLRESNLIEKIYLDWDWDWEEWTLPENPSNEPW